MGKSVSGTEPGQRQLNGPQTSGRDYRNLSKPQHEITREDDMAVPMRDGVQLLADVFRPTAPGRVVGWFALLLILLVTTLLLGWIILGFVLLGSGPSQDAQPVSGIFLLLLVFCGISAWLTARYIASWRSVWTMIFVILAVVAFLGGDWMMSAPLQALYLARDIAWDGTGIGDYRKYPRRTINNAPPVFQFRQNLLPNHVRSIEFRQGGQLKQTTIEEFLSATRTAAFVVIQDGSILQESYANGYARDSMISSFSIAKSFTSALIGIAIEEGFIGSLDDPMVTYLPELRGKGLDGVTLRHLLTMSAGVAYRHEDEQPWVFGPLPINDDTRTTNFPDLRRLALSARPNGDAPGTVFEYNNFLPLLVGMILERTTHRPVAQYLQEKIWQPLGMEYGASWSLDSQDAGFEKMSMGLNARAIDFAKFGALFLASGRWRGKQVVPESWVFESTSPDAKDARRWRRAAVWKKANGYYKYFWWGLRRQDGSYAYMARGNLQQHWIYVSPRDRVVIVRFGLVDGSADSWPDILETISSKLAGQTN
jgi:CubicO group peptidase (beta-lactamase class C family)